ncbi:MAG: glycosyltransferase [Chryseotalea sp. WA131a]|jgi:glycosyltransferase involved in cell wall biosynthesis|nr:MAG: glycosyltransferase [Chryseotalea sp. WA131a]
MRILHIGSGDLASGAGKGLYNLHLALLEANIESRVLCQIQPKEKLVNVFPVNTKWTDKIRRFLYTHIEKLPLLFYPKRDQQIFSNSLLGFDISNSEHYVWANIIHFHWVNQGMIAISSMKKLKKPIVWTLRDMWLFTGGCHHSFACQNYRHGCGNCPYLKSTKLRDLSYFNYRRKLRYVKNISVTAISPWLSDIANESLLFQQNIITSTFIPNIIDTDKFKPKGRAINKLYEILPDNKKIILVGATDIRSPYKGYQYLEPLFEAMGDSYHWIFFGGSTVSNQFLLSNKNYTDFGYVNSDEELCEIYSVADVFLAPSVAEAFGKTIIEAQACGTPVVCFNATGPQALVEHLVTGYKATPFESGDLMKGLQYVTTSNIKEINAKLIRGFAERFSKTTVVGDYVAFYKQVLREKGNHEN